jgi:hypothetical protein
MKGPGSNLQLSHFTTMRRILDIILASVNILGLGVGMKTK